MDDREESSRRTLALYALPLLGLLLLLLAAPLVRGTGTLYLRDVLNTHFPMKQTQAEASLHSAQAALSSPPRRTED